MRYEWHVFCLQEIIEVRYYKSETHPFSTACALTWKPTFFHASSAFNMSTIASCVIIISIYCIFAWKCYTQAFWAFKSSVPANKYTADVLASASDASIFSCLSIVTGRYLTNINGFLITRRTNFCEFIHWHHMHTLNNLWLDLEYSCRLIQKYSIISYKRFCFSPSFSIQAASMLSIFITFYKILLEHGLHMASFSCAPQFYVSSGRKILFPSHNAYLI